MGQGPKWFPPASTERSSADGRERKKQFAPPLTVAAAHPNLAGLTTPDIKFPKVRNRLLREGAAGMIGSPSVVLTSALH